MLGAVLTDRISGMSALMILALILFSSLDLPVPCPVCGFLFIPVVLAGVYLFIRWFYPYFIKAYWVALIYSLGVQLLQLACVAMILLALGVRENIYSYFLVFLVSSIVALLPVSIGGIGLRELTFLYGTRWLGIDPETGVGVSLMFYLITAMVSLAGLWFVVRPVTLDQQSQAFD